MKLVGIDGLDISSMVLVAKRWRRNRGRRGRQLEAGTRFEGGKEGKLRRTSW